RRGGVGLGENREGCEHREGHDHAEARRRGELHGCTTGSPRCTTSCFAVSIGSLATPFCLSTHPALFSDASSAALMSAMSVSVVFVFGGGTCPSCFLL